MAVENRLEQMIQVLSGIVTASIKLHRVSNELLNQSSYNLSHTEFTVLVTIRRAKKATVPQIAEKNFISRQAVQRQVTQLTNEGLLEKRVNPTHKRSQYYCLTNQGEATFEAICQDVLDPWVTKLLAEQGQEDLKSALKVLNKIIEHDY